MKKIYIYIASFAFAALSLGCSKEVDIQDELPGEDEVVATGDGETITVTLSVPESEDTKTTLGAKSGSTYPVYWSSNDVITLNGTAATEFTPASGNATATAKFGKINNLTAPYNFLYCGVSGQPNQVSFPSAQSYVSGGFDPAAMPMYASVTDLNGTIAFSHVAALLKFSLTCESEKKIDSVTLTAADGSKSLSGNFTIGATNGILNGGLTPASGGGTINYNFGGHKTLGDTPFIFYVAIPAGTYDGGITLDIVDNARGHMAIRVLDSDATKTIAAGTVREFADVVYVPETDANLKMIWNATTFQEFVTAVAGGNKTLNARLTPNADSINLSSIAGSFESIEDYEGTFDGNGKTLNFGTSTPTQPLFANLKGVVKNLTVNAKIEATASDGYHWGIFAKQIIPSLESDDIAGLQNCTANGSIRWTPSSAVNSIMTLGGLVGNNRGGIIMGCTNNATVTFANNGVSNGNQPSIGGVVGRTQKGGELNTQGDISSCTNYGDVVCAAEFGQNIYIGGVLGYQVEKAETMSGCVNHGLVKVASTASTGEALHLGGVVGLAKGVMENCTNASDGEVTTEACSVGTYLCQGGVVGRLNNDAGLIYETLTNAGTLNVAAMGGSTARLIGGVVGRWDQGAVLSGVTNSGDINYTSLEELLTYIGGVAASNTKAGISLVNCNSTGGTLTYNGETARGPLYIGGVVGFSTQPVSSCTNAMKLNIGGDFTPTSNNQYFSTGGIVGKVSSNALISNCLNTGEINHSLILSGSYGYTFVGGIVGHTNGSIADCSNGGIVTITGKNAANNPFYGGVVGSTDSANEHSITGKYSSASATNYGSVVVNTTVQTNKYIYIGGVAGRVHTSGTMIATNNGPITITNLKCTQAYIGGLAGFTNAASSAVNSGSANLSGGTITVTTLTANGASSYCAFIGGVVGQAKGAVTATNAANISVNGITAKDRMAVGGVVGNNNTSSAVVTGTNGGSIIISSGSTSSNNIFLGGVVGHGQGNITNSINNGPVSNAAPVTGDGQFIQVGGIVGYNNSSSAISGCTNNGNVTNSGSAQGYVYVGGITSETEADITSCHNTGTVSNSGVALVQKTNDKVYQINVSGVAGHNTGATITSCYNTGAVSNSANSGAGIMVGGVTGEAVGGTYVTCYNTGSISNTGFAYDSAERGDSALGGLVGFLNGNVTMSGTSSAYNYNSGTLSESSTTAYVAMGGIAGIVKGNCDLTYVKNLAAGDITCSSNTRTKIYVGGVVGVAQRVFTMDDASNAGDLNFSGLTISSGVYVGGVLGAFSDADVDGVKSTSCTLNRLTNSGKINSPENNMMAASTDVTGYSYIGGISGVGNCANKSFIDCGNSGEIYVYNNLKTRLGGVLAYTNVNPTGSWCHENIRYLRQDVSDCHNGGVGEIGGVVGYMNLKTISNLSYEGTLNTRSSYGTCYTGGIIGRIASSGSGAGNVTTFSNCRVAGKVQGAGTDFNTSGPGLFAARSNKKEDGETAIDTWNFSFPGCIVRTGTIMSAKNNTTITSSNVDTWVIGRYAPSSIATSPSVGSWSW